jgi:hypothetical protein
VDDIYIRVDVHPHQVYKFDGSSWIQINRHTSTDYLENRSYIKYIIDKLGAGEYDPVHLSAEESIKISEYLKQTI